jgi:hypothetical protein
MTETYTGTQRKSWPATLRKRHFIYSLSHIERASKIGGGDGGHMITQVLAEQLLNNPVSEGLGLLLKLKYHKI